MCKCIEQVNEALAAHNAVLDIPLTIHLTTGKTESPRTYVPTVKLNSKNRQKLPILFAMFCPFCGKKYPADVNS